MEILIRDQFGFVAYQFPTGALRWIYTGQILGTFCPGCVNLLPVNILPRVDEDKIKQKTDDSTEQEDNSNDSNGDNTKNESNEEAKETNNSTTGLFIAVICLSGVVLVLIF